MLSNNYVLILLWTGVLAVLYFVMPGVRRVELVNGRQAERVAPWFAVMAVLPLVYFASVRGAEAGDTVMYIEAYAEMPSRLSGLSEYISTVQKDQGFYYVSALIKCLIGDRVAVYFFIVAAIQCFLIFRVFRKYAPAFVTVFFLFIASSDFFSWIFNGMRQFTAVAITVACFPFILKKKSVPAIIGILIASLFHQSALLVIPFIFIVQGKAWNKKTIFFIAASIIAVLFIDRFTGVLDAMLAETQYKNVVSDWQEWNDDGTNFLRVLVYSIPSLLSLVGIRYVRCKDDPVINICVNMSIVSMGFYIVSMFTSGIFIGRLPIYFSLYGYILLPWLIKHVFTEKSAKLVQLCMVAAYLVFYYYQMHLTWALF